MPFSPIYLTCISTILKFGPKENNLGTETKIKEEKHTTRVQGQRKGHSGGGRMEHKIKMDQEVSRQWGLVLLLCVFPVKCNIGNKQIKVFMDRNVPLK